MMGRRDLMRGGLAALTFALVACERKSNEYHFKLTVEVEAPEGVVRGSSVWGIVPERIDNPLAGPGARLHFQGEAVAVDLPGGQTLFALLTGANGDVDYARQLPGRALGSPMYGKAAPPGRFKWREFAELYPTHPDTIGLYGTNPLPTLVRFKDINDPKSVERVNSDALEGAFGPGVKLKRITLEKTKEPITFLITKRLPSYGPGSGFDQWYKGLRYGDPRSVSFYDFKQDAK